MSVDQWKLCYQKTWKGFIVDEAFCHPAKFSHALIGRIYDHAITESWLKRGDTVLDPFGGVALGALYALVNGLNWIGLELEPKFVKLGQQNIDLWNRKFKHWPNLGTARIIQGDSRRIKEVVKEAGLILSSPPFSSQNDGGGIAKSVRGDSDYPVFTGNARTKKAGISAKGIGYQGQGHTPGNLANMKEGSVEAVISSPPWENQEPSHAQGTGFEPSGQGRRTFINSQYGKNKGNLGNTSGDTFWQSSKEIVQGCYDLLRPGGHAIWVVKSYVNKGKIVDFPGRWQVLCKSAGFKTIHAHHALLVEEYGSRMKLNGDEEEIRTEKKSFFRRLCESKGSPKIDWETILCMVKE